VGSSVLGTGAMVGLGVGLEVGLGVGPGVGPGVGLGVGTGAMVVGAMLAGSDVQLLIASLLCVTVRE
jgi:hypothetical protein